MKNKLFLVVVVVILVFVGFCLLKNKRSADTIPVSSQVISAGFCGDLFRKDNNTLVYIGERNAQYGIVSSTTIDVSGISQVKNVVIEPAVSLPLKDWMTQQSPLSWATTETKTCAPGWVHITGNMNGSGVFQATDITERAQ